MASIIIGLGNVGAEYENTRHNVGFWVLDAIAESRELKFERGEGPYSVIEMKYRGKPLYLIKPTNYMNNSGKALRKACSKYGVDLKNCLVVYDDIHLEEGKIRIRAKGSHGGHNGIRDIIAQFGSQDFPRIRIGVGSNFRPGQQADYVLSPFAPDQIPFVEEACANAKEAALGWLKHDLPFIMNKYSK